jgi:hypothetical protein
MADWLDRVKGGGEIAASLLGNSFYDFGALGAEALSSPINFARGFGNKDAATQFAADREQRRSQLPTYQTGHAGSQVGEDVMNSDAAKRITSALTGFAEENPNATEAFMSYLQDPRVMHTLGGAELAVPAIARMGKAAFSGAGKLPDITGGNQRGSVELFGEADPSLQTELARIKAERPELSDFQNEIKFIHHDTKDVGVEDRVKTTGHYRGAPRNIDTPQSLGSMRKSLREMMIEGVPGMDWYDESSNSMIDLTGGRKNFQHLAAGANAITSQGTGVSSNQNFGVKGYNEALLDRPVRAGRFGQGGKINQIARGEPLAGGPKIDPFYEALTIGDRPQGVRPTNDLWMARAFGYKRLDPKTGQEVEWSEGLGDAQHRFMDKEVSKLAADANKNKIGGREDWSPEKVQAAIWVAVKARTEGTSIDDAAYNFSSNLENLTAHNRYEVRPSTSLNHRGEMGATQEYADIVNSMLQNDQGRNRIALGLGAQTRPSATGFGIYEGATSPSTDVPIMAAPSTGTQTLDPAGRDLSKAHGAITGMITGQDTVGNSYLRNPGPGYPTNSAVINSGSAPSAEGMQQIEQALVANGLGGKAYPLHTASGFQIVQDPEAGIDPKDFQKAMRTIAQSFGVKPEYKHNSGIGLMGNTNWDDPGFKPSAWMRELDAANLDPATMGRADEVLRGSAKTLFDVDEAIDRLGIDLSDELLQRTRKIAADGGVEGIRDAVAKKVLPAVVLGLLGTQAYEDPQRTDEPS